MWKKWAVMLLCLILTLLAACSSTSTSSTSDSSSSSASSSGGEQQQQVYKLIASIQSPKEAYLSKGFDAFLDRIEEKSGGRIVFERYYAEALVKAADHLQAAASGIADLAAINPSFTPSETPLSSIGTLPSLWENMKAGTLAYRALFEKYPQFNEEFEKLGVKIVGHAAYPSFYIITNRENTDNFEKIKGLKLLANGYQGMLAEAMGVVPSAVVLTESFELMERGTIDGVMLGFSSAAAYGIHEIAKTVWKLPVGSAAGVYGMNMNTYNSLPDDLKQVIAEAALENIDDFHQIYQVEGEEASMEKFVEKGVNIVEPSAEDVARVQQMAREHVWMKWAEEMKKLGHPAEEILNTFVEEINKYEAEMKK